MMTNEELYAIPLTSGQFLTIRNCLIDYERMVRQKLMRKHERGEDIPPEVLDLVVALEEVNDIIDEERLKIAYRNGVSHGKQC
jgi:hypothetical protein